MNFTVVGAGYVGASSGVLLARKNHVIITDTSHIKLQAIDDGFSPVSDFEMSRILSEEEPDIHTAEPGTDTYRESDFVLVATPTNFDSDTGCLDTSTVESVISDIVSSGGEACIVVKSTVPLGFMDRMAHSYPDKTLLYAPEFLREGSAMYDQLHPSRVVIGTDGKRSSASMAEYYASVLAECTETPDVPKLVMSYGEAEAVKLFSNTYLAMRVAFFNELDTLAEMKGFDTKKIIDGVCLEPRIGDFYNNPSFGFGGYCLPKDARQLLTNFEMIPQRIIGATVEANERRAEHIVGRVLEKLRNIRARQHGEQFDMNNGSVGVVGVYRLVMKNGSDNLRESSVLNVVQGLRSQGVEVLIYEPIVDSTDCIEGCELVESLEELKRRSDLIVANRWSEELEIASDKLYTRDIFHRN